MDRTRPANIDWNNNYNNCSNINNEKEVIVLQSDDTKVKPVLKAEESEERIWRGPEGEAGSRAWVVQVFIINCWKSSFHHM